MGIQGDSSDLELIQQSLQGKEEAFSQLVDRHQTTLVNFLKSMDVKLIEIDDLCQDIWIKLYDYRSRYEAKAKFSTFLYQVAKMKVIDEHRKKKRWFRVLEGFSQTKILDREQEERRNFSQIEHEKSMETYMSILGREAKEVLVLRFEEDMSYQEIGELLNIPLGTVKSRIHTALKKMKELT
jgi:RNA polymerase sigma-70 factor (ECF subfamily)